MFNKANYKKRDEYYTQAKDVELIIPYLKKDWKIWCPFDKQESQYVQVLQNQGFEVVYGHIETGQDFFKTNVECDCIVSNPPYSLKYEVFKRLFELNKPFAMFVHEQGIFEGNRFDLFKDKEFEILIPRHRARFENKYGKYGCPPFKTNYYCHKLLPKQIVFVGGK